MDLELCKQWERAKKTKKDKVTNPLTGKSISKYGPTAKKLNIQCVEYGLSNRRSRENSLSDDRYIRRGLEEGEGDIRRGLEEGRYSPPTRVRQQIKTPDYISEGESDLIYVQYNDPSIKERIKKNKFIEDYFKNIVATEKSLCFSKKNIHKYFENLDVIKKGKFGNIYAGVIKKTSYTLALKEKEMSSEMYNEAMRKHFPKEMLWNHLVNKLLEKAECPHFLYSYVTLFCGGSLTSQTSYSLTLNELADGPLNSIKQEKKYYKNALFQILHALHMIHSKYGLIHNNITEKNILIKFNHLYHQNSYWVYHIDDQSYYIQNLGFVAYLTDFSDSMSQSYEHSKGNLGIRNARVVNGSFEPFTTRYYPEIGNNLLRGKHHSSSSKLIPENIEIIEIDSPPLSNKKGTVNKFWKGFNSEPDISIDFDNFQEFPTFDMYLDIQSVLSIFAKNKFMKSYVTPYIKKISVNSPWEDPKLFLANLLIKDIFKTWRNRPLSDYKIIDTFGSVTTELSEIVIRSDKAVHIPPPPTRAPIYPPQHGVPMYTLPAPPPRPPRTYNVPPPHPHRTYIPPPPSRRTYNMQPPPRTYTPPPPPPHRAYIPPPLRAYIPSPPRTYNMPPPPRVYNISPPPPSRRRKDASFDMEGRRRELPMPRTPIQDVVMEEGRGRRRELPKTRRDVVIDMRGMDEENLIDL
jgi:hypothetical protein